MTMTAAAIDDAFAAALLRPMDPKIARNGLTAGELAALRNDATLTCLTDIVCGENLVVHSVTNMSAPAADIEAARAGAAGQVVRLRPLDELARGIGRVEVTRLDRVPNVRDRYLAGGLNLRGALYDIECIFRSACGLGSPLQAVATARETFKYVLLIGQRPATAVDPEDLARRLSFVIDNPDTGGPHETTDGVGRPPPASTPLPPTAVEVFSKPELTTLFNDWT